MLLPLHVFWLVLLLRGKVLSEQRRSKFHTGYDTGETTSRRATQLSVFFWNIALKQQQEVIDS